MSKKPRAYDLSEDQQREVETLAGGKIVRRLSGRLVGDKVSVDFVACSAPFLACEAYSAAGNAAPTPCNAPFLACKEHLTAGSIAINACNAPIQEKAGIFESDTCSSNI